MNEIQETSEFLDSLHPKFFALDEEKRGRIINAAMAEFLHGFAQAKTDNIVKEAGISKGLLFHYFGTKENLYDFLIDYAIDTIRAEFIEMINPRQPDILDSVWQMSLLKQDISRRFPAMFDFITSTYLDTRHSMNPVQAAHVVKFTQLRDKVLAESFEHCDKSLFRDEIDPQKAIKIIMWSLAGYAEEMTAEAKAAGLSTVGSEARENYDRYLSEFRDYLNILRTCIYKPN
ncbi:MAG: TetR/AcrR family transcriptional regulator [Defluviitaleaceae bacterium]|nr:TetR/AcrR family transcriptional regulator [Defluviitaleaceae bacterium]